MIIAHLGCEMKILGSCDRFSRSATWILRVLGADNVLATEVGDEEVATVDDDDDAAGEEDGIGETEAAEDFEDEATEHNPEDRVEDGDEEREGEEDGDLAKKGAIEHFFAGADFAEHDEFVAVVTAFGKFFEGENSGAGDEEDETEVESDEGDHGAEADAVVDDILASADAVIVDVFTVFAGVVFEEAVIEICDLLFVFKRTAGVAVITD